ncbi:MAG: hypothetical protein A2Y10_02700 [Planctomycetes bacterium GWF2_41_51]|nr:MAG: hypothetical protein A2Y10_02700 [Planctomycetes bacterium GWF2_41_51]HBG27459.1 hypothetical protein [Phycisphaerales bacterium]
MNRSICRFILLFIVIYFTAPAFALRLAGNPAELTTDPRAYPHTIADEFDFSGRLVVWIDSRDDVNYVPRVYAARLNDNSHTEYLIDVNAFNASAVRTDGVYIAYFVWNESMLALRIADITDINNPVIKEIEIAASYVDSFEVDNGVVVFKENGDGYSIPSVISAVSLSDPFLTKHTVKEFPFNDYSYTNISLDSNRVIWSGEYYDDVNYLYSNYIDVADITDIANPVVARNSLPQTQTGGYIVWINALAVSDDWLIARGSYNDTDCVFGVHNYYDPQNWSFTMIRQMDSYKEFILRVDAPYAVWVENDMQHPEFTGRQMQTQSQSVSSEQGIIVGAVLFDNGKTVTSIIKTSDQNWTLMGAAVSGGKVVWGADYFYADPETESAEEYRDLFTDTLELECGDRGYSLADLNRDCKVDFADFAIMSERWLVCTLPNDEICIDGEVY